MRTLLATKQIYKPLYFITRMNSKENFPTVISYSDFINLKNIHIYVLFLKEVFLSIKLYLQFFAGSVLLKRLVF